MNKNVVLLFFAQVILFYSCDQPHKNYSDGKILFVDNFDDSLSNWVVEQTPDGLTRINNGCLEIDGGGTTVWFRELINGPVRIEYEATLISEGGRNDNCRDLNCFWMARHPRAPYDLFTGWRSNSINRAGIFGNYDDLRTYYVGMGGHMNTTTRFRRYTGHGDKPLLPEHDLAEKKYMLEPGRKYKITLVACNNIIQYFRDGEIIFDYFDPQPYTSGWFGLRTVSNHMLVDNFKVTTLVPVIGSRNLQKEHESAVRSGLNKNLAAQSIRKGWRDQSLFRSGEGFLSEKTVFHDPATGAEIWRLTNDPSIESNEYFDIPVFSADGRYILFVTRRNGKAERWLMNSDGTNLRPVSDKASMGFEKGFWSILYPDIIYFAEKQNREGLVFTRIIEMNVINGLTRLITEVKGDMGTMQPPHPSENLFLFVDQMGGEYADKDHPSRAITVTRDGKVYVAPFERMVHRLRFTKSPDGRIFSNFDDPRTTWTSNYDGSDRREIPFEGGHPDWVPGGKMLFFNARQLMPDGTVEFDVRYDAVDQDGKNLRTIFPYGGHASACLDGMYFACDGGEGSGSVNYVSLDERNIAITLFPNHTSRYDHSNKWHPDHHSTHPHPNSSPDGTKIVSNSDVLAQFTDIFLSVSRLPDPPRKPVNMLEGPVHKLIWNRPFRCRETKGYIVYGTNKTGRDYQRLFAEPVKDTFCIIPADAAMKYYVVTAIEHSGLESRPTMEVAGTSGSDGSFSTISIEAETVIPAMHITELPDMKNASDGRYICPRDSDCTENFFLETEVSCSGEYNVWARIRGKGKLTLQEGNKMTDTLVPGETNWKWEKFSNQLALTEGYTQLKMSFAEGHGDLDRMILTTDGSFIPDGKMKTDETPPSIPEITKIYFVSPGNVRIEMKKPEDVDFGYFNIYSSFSKDFSCDQFTLTGSPSGNIFIDWGLPVDTKVYYRICSVDNSGNESEPSGLFLVKPDKFSPGYIYLPVEGGSIVNMSQAVTPQNGNVYLVPEDEMTSSVSWNFEIKNDGYYAIYGSSVCNTDKKMPGFTVFIDDEITTSWKPFGMYGTWKLSPVGGKHCGTPEHYYLARGSHIMKVVPENRDSYAGGFVISNDPSFSPVDEMKSTGY
ncbi:MAG TPA: DUF6250 domain-containing protein [Bacteroidales bacterium]|nr:DUF6250 domain-containing protein [Bacteroidales bacterium]HPR12856.1 DUF6250 domain-containing protein [Bacteroidales bacterium]